MCAWRVRGMRAHRPQPLRAHAIRFVHLLEELVARHAQLLGLLRVLLLGHPLRRQLLSLRQLRVELHVRRPFGLGSAVCAFDAADEEHALQRDDLQLRVVRLGAVGRTGAQHGDEGAAAEGHLTPAARDPEVWREEARRGTQRGDIDQTNKQPDQHVHADVDKCTC
eukprot:scaffold51579_cov64-Phaeocystis_antarctica.AAC.2